MKAALAAVAPRAGSWDAVIWAGVGHGADLEAVRALGGRQCYVEPHPGLRRRLQARLGAAGGASVEARPLWSTDGQQVFHLANDAVSSTLLAPDEAWAGRPNLRVVEDVEVETRSLATLLEVLSLEQDATALLILDIGGGEEELLAGSEEPVLRRFGHVLLPSRCDQAATRLEALGYTRESVDDSWCLLAQPEQEPRDLEKEVERMSAELAARSKEFEELARALEQAHREMEAISKAREELAAERDQSVAACSAAMRQRDDDVSARSVALGERDKAMAERSAALSERDAADARAASLQQQLTDFSRESATTIAALTAERDAAIGSLTEKTALAEQLQAERDALQSQVQNLTSEILEARRTAALSVKLQARRDTDLDDLQQRYRESQDIQERQRKLLERLGERLGEASRYFHQLADEREKG